MQPPNAYIETLQNIGKKMKFVFGSSEWTESQRTLLSCADRLEKLTPQDRLCDIEQAYADMQKAMQHVTSMFSKLTTSPNN